MFPDYIFYTISAYHILLLFFMDKDRRYFSNAITVSLNSQMHCYYILYILCKYSVMYVWALIFLWYLYS